MSGTIAQKVAADLLKREAIGIVKYGAEPGAAKLSRREHLQHAYEAAMDLASYLKAEIEREAGAVRRLPKDPMWLRELKAMIGRGWLFSGIAKDGRWQSDPDLQRLLDNGWVRHDPSMGFEITQAGIDYCVSQGGTPR